MPAPERRPQIVRGDGGFGAETLMRVSALLSVWTACAAEQLRSTTVWRLVCDHLKLILAGIDPPHPPRLLANHAHGIG